MEKLALLTGAYEARSVIAAAQRCVNLYSEKDPEDEEAKVTYYPTPGLVQLAVPAVVGAGRCLYTTTTEDLLAVIGSGVYQVSSTWALTLLGTIGTSIGPVKMCDNGQTVFIVDGSPSGYLIDLATMTFSPLLDGSGVFRGGTVAVCIDTFTLFDNPAPNSQEFYSTLSETSAFDGTYYALKNGSPDPLMTLAVKRHEIWLIGSKSTEIWYNVGGTAFPFQRLAGTFFDIGTCAKYSVAQNSTGLFWLSKNALGQLLALNVGNGNYEAVKISTYALENEWQTYDTVEDAWAFTYQQAGHVFYVLTFPTQDVTWVFDVSERHWHQRASLDGLGAEHRWRAADHALAYGTHVVIDYANGALYSLDLEIYDEVGAPVKRIRSFPHTRNNNKRVFYDAFVADMAVGAWDSAVEPTVQLRWSDTKGATWNQPVAQTMGRGGEYYTNIQWSRLGMARDRVFELSWTAPVKTALNGAYVGVGVEA